MPNEINKLNHISIYTEASSERQTYVFDFVFKEIFGLSYAVTHSLPAFENNTSFKINYSNNNIPADLHIAPNGLLAELDMKPRQIQISYWHHLPIFFQNEGADISFDIFSAAFYLISRYEEYLTHTTDVFLRYPHSDSLAYRNNFLQIPLVDLWLQELKKIILSKNNALPFKENAFCFLPTYDIDIAYSYLGKSISRNIGGAFQDLLKGNTAAISERMDVLHNKQKDPYDSYEFLDALHTKYLLNPIYFFLVGKNGKLDKNIPFENDIMQNLFANISAKYEVGIHPSFQSNDHKELLKTEITKIKTTKSRQHYIRFNLPNTFQNLLEQGITEEYSMGYGSINGFRASTCFPFYWFDVSKNKITPLRIFPFCFMECNSKFEQHQSVEEALTEQLHYYGQVKKVNGLFITIWHNFSLGSDPIWKGWKEIYEKLFETISLEK